MYCYGFYIRLIIIILYLKIKLVYWFILILLASHLAKVGKVSACLPKKSPPKSTKADKPDLRFVLFLQQGKLICFFLVHRFLGLQIFFIFGGFVCFFLSFMVLKRTNSTQEQNEKMSNQTKRERFGERCQTDIEEFKWTPQ